MLHFYNIKNIVKDGVDIRLKWPNDLILENGKVGGILLESIQVPNSGKIGLIVGVGVNLTSAPKITANAINRYDTQCVAKFSNNKIDQSIFFSNLNDELIKIEANLEGKNL